MKRRKLVHFNGEEDVLEEPEFPRDPPIKMSDSGKVSPIVGQEVWAAVSVVFCVAVIMVFFCILCCAYRRHRRVRDLSMFTPPVQDELGSYPAPWVVSNVKDKSITNQWTSGV